MDNATIGLMAATIYPHFLVREGYNFDDARGAAIDHAIKLADEVERQQAKRNPRPDLARAQAESLYNGVRPF
jgi:hypothetical protein